MSGSYEYDAEDDDARDDDPAYGYDDDAREPLWIDRALGDGAGVLLALLLFFVGAGVRLSAVAEPSEDVVTGAAVVGDGLGLETAPRMTMVMIVRSCSRRGEWRARLLARVRRSCALRVTRSVKVLRTQYTETKWRCWLLPPAGPPPRCSCCLLLLLLRVTAADADAEALASRIHCQSLARIARFLLMHSYLQEGHGIHNRRPVRARRAIAPVDSLVVVANASNRQANNHDTCVSIPTIDMP